MSTRRAEHAVRGRFATPWGEGLATVWQGRLAAVELPPLGESVAGGSDADADAADRRSLDRWVSQLEAYFRGERLCWTSDEVNLDQWAMTPFQRAVYETLLSVPAGNASWALAIALRASACDGTPLGNDASISVRLVSRVLISH